MIFADLGYWIRRKCSAAVDSLNGIRERHPYLSTKTVRSALAVLKKTNWLKVEPRRSDTVFSFVGLHEAVEILDAPKPHWFRVAEAQRHGLVAACILTNFRLVLGFNQKSDRKWVGNDPDTGEPLTQPVRREFGELAHYVTISKLRRYLPYISRNAAIQALAKLVDAGVLRRHPLPPSRRARKGGKIYAYSFVHRADLEAPGTVDSASDQEQETTDNILDNKHMQPRSGDGHVPKTAKEVPRAAHEVPRTAKEVPTSASTDNSKSFSKSVIDENRPGSEVDENSIRPPVGRNLMRAGPATRPGDGADAPNSKAV